MALVGRLVHMRATVCFAVSSALSLLGNSVAGVVLPLVLLATTGDVLAAGSLAVICAIPQAVCGVLGGAVLDRVNRRTVSIASDVVSALCVAALPIVDATVGLSFGWFALFGVLGAVGDVPGMTARDTLMPAVTRHDGISLERYMGVGQSIESLVTIAGPAIAAGIIALGGGASALWVTAGMSLAAAFATCGIPHRAGAVGVAGDGVSGLVDLAAPTGMGRPSSHAGSRLAALLRTGFLSLREGLAILFAGNPLVRSTLLLGLGIVVVMGGYEGIVLPAFFTESGSSALLGVMLSVLSVGMLVGSLVYSAAVRALSRRTWYVVSLVGMMAGVALVGALPSTPVMLAGCVLLGLAAGPFSALVGFLMLDAIPDERRGAAMGTQNTLMLLASPVAVFGASVLIEVLSLRTASWVLVGLWGLVTLAALVAPGMRKLG